MSEKNLLRQSQVVGAFGPGAMVDLPERSVMIGGLGMWSSNNRSEGWRLVDEPRLRAHLENTLKIARLELRTPPEHDRNARFLGPHVGAVVFPLWFVCEELEHAEDGHKRRRLLRWNDLDPSDRRHFRDGGKAKPVTPIRFVGACDHGHIQDIDWKWIVHRGEKCSAPMYMEERGTSGDTRDTAIVCGCGKRFTLSQAYIRPQTGSSGPLGPCAGHRPWLGEEFRQTCGEPLKLLNRTATNAYFSQALSVISIPTEVDALTGLVSRHHETLRKAPSPAIINIYRDANPAIAADFADYTDQEVFDATARLTQASQTPSSGKPRDIEFELLSSSAPEIGLDAAGSLFFARTLPRDAWDRSRLKTFRGLKAVVAVHRLREVTCQYGFTRLESAMTADVDLEDELLNVQMAKLADPVTWLPAIEQFGEGVFLQFDSAVLAAWKANPKVQERAARLEAGHKQWTDHRYAGKKAPAFLGVAYYLAHSLSHALMSEIAMECGYPQSALKERIFHSPTDLGLLIYTAAGDGEGTLGGLVALAPRLGEFVLRALERAGLCSNDPTCSDHDPAVKEDDRHLQGAACHGCLLTSETSCEARNDYLDRALLVEDLGDTGAAFFR
jgi:hypothetical protein